MQEGQLYQPNEKFWNYQSLQRTSIGIVRRELLCTRILAVEKQVILTSRHLICIVANTKRHKRPEPLKPNSPLIIVSWASWLLNYARRSSTCSEYFYDTMNVSFHIFWNNSYIPNYWQASFWPKQTPPWCRCLQEQNHKNSLNNKQVYFIYIRNQ